MVKSSEAFYERARDDVKHTAIFTTSGCEPHFHGQVELLCVKRGRIRVGINDSNFVLSAGGISISDSFDIHGYELLDPDAVGYVLIYPERGLTKFRTETKNAYMTSHEIQDIHIYENVLKLLEMMIAYNEERSPRERREDDLLITSLGEAVMGFVSKGIIYADSRGDTERLDTMRKALSYIADHFDEDLKLEQVSRMFGYTPNHFSRLFNTYVKKGFREYINDRRVEKAAELLKSGADVTDAAMESGFNSLRTFYRCYAERIGGAPRNAAEELRQNQL